MTVKVAYMTKTHGLLKFEYNYLELFLKIECTNVISFGNLAMAFNESVNHKRVNLEQRILHSMLKLGQRHRGSIVL